MRTRKAMLTFMSIVLVVALAACAPGVTPTPSAVEAPTLLPATPTASETEMPAEAETPTEAATPAEGAAAAPAQFTFWASGGGQTVFWQEIAAAYTQEHPGVTIDVSTMPEQPTSEAAIQTAIAGGTAPAGSENIFIGFAQQLAASQAIVPLDTMPGWQELLQARNMEQTIQGWQFPDGHYYVLPIYSNAMLMGWRTDILQQIGVETPPRTYSEVLDLGARLKEQSPDTFVWARAELTQDTWWQRWFDFFMFYYAASDGQPLISGTEITADDQAAVETLAFFGDLAENEYLLTQTTTDPFETGLSVMSSIGPWTFPFWQERFPELQLDETFALAPPPVPDDYPADQPVKTFADAKGLVIYAQASPEVQQAVWDFYRWVFSDPQHDLTWLETTNLPPARDDLTTNPTFQAVFEANPALVPYAEQIPYAVPPLSAGTFQEIQTQLGQQAVVPVVLGQKEPQQAWDDFKNVIQSLLQ